ALTQADDAHLAGDVSQAGLAGHALCHQQSDGVGAAVHGPHADGTGAARLGMWGILLVGAHASVPPSSGIPSSSGVGQSCGIAAPRSPFSAASATDSSPRRTTPGPSASAYAMSTCRHLTRSGIPPPEKSVPRSSIALRLAKNRSWASR